MRELMIVSNMINEAINTIVRVHDPKRLVELDRALFSLLNQTHKPVKAVIVLQNLTSHIDTIAKLAARFDWLAHGHLAPIVVEFNSPEEDCRSDLLNLGIANSEGAVSGLSGL
jgi:hypothetical protein